MSSDIDLSTRARIRNAALALFSEIGFVKATVRAIATQAGVSPGLVIHHFGSKEGLRAACDEHLLTWIRNEKTAVFSGMAMPSTSDYVERNPEFTVLYAYLRRVLLDENAASDSFFDHFVEDIKGYLAVGEVSGMVRPYHDSHARAVISAAIGLGLMAFDSKIARHLGGDSLLDPPVLDRYAAYTLELYTHGMLTTPPGVVPEPGESRPGGPDAVPTPKEAS